MTATLKKNPTLRGYNLRIELIAFAAVLLLLFIIVGLVQRELREKFIDSAFADAAQFDLFMDRQLQLAHEELVEISKRFPNLPVASSMQSTHFSDVYRLNKDFEILEIIQSERGNDLFPGFIFGSGVMTEFLQSAQQGGLTSSGLIRGYEQEIPSVYLATTSQSNIFLGRIDLRYYNTLIQDYSSMANADMLITTSAGLVMMRSSNSLTLPQVSQELLQSSDSTTARSVTIGGEKRLWVRSKIRALNAELFMLTSTKLLAQIQNILWALSLFLLLLLGALILYKQWSINRLVLDPLKILSRRFTKIAAGDHSTNPPISAQHVQELSELSERFDDMANKVAQREAALAEEQSKLREAKQHAEHLEKVKTEFLANMSHEIRTPLTVILGLNHLLASGASFEQMKKIEQIESSGQSLLTLINDILDLEKIEAGKLKIRREPFSLVSLAQAVVEKYRLLIDTSTALTLDLSNAPETPLIGDPLRLEQVLNNLLSNAIKFARQGEIEVSISTLKQTSESLLVRFAVRDSGVGIPMTQINDLFEPFIQADNSLARQFSGTGLGLPISKHLVELMGGTIGVESVVGKGSTFWFELPLATPAINCVPITQSQTLLKPRAIRDFDLEGLHILVVDDSATIRGIVEETLQAAGARVSLTENGFDALQFLEHNAVDLVLLDVQMPIMDGLTCAQLIRKKQKLSQLPVIALTAGVFSSQQQDVFIAGMNGILSKPIVFDEMVKTIAYWSGRLTPKSSSQTIQSHQAIPFPDLAGIDRASAEIMSQANLPLFLHLLELFRNEYQHAADELEAALQRGQWVEAGKLLHKIRGSASQIGARTLANTAALIEKQLKESQTSLPETLLQRFHKELAELLVEPDVVIDVEEQK